ncbi:alpha/beta fold hydrolase [Huintestinicola sp.]
MRNFSDEYRDFLKTHSYKPVTVSGHEFRVIDSGSGSQTIVFLNGIDTQQEWINYVSALEKNYRVVMMKYPVKVYKNKEMIVLLHELFDKLKITLPIICGISDGGVLGQLYAKNYKVGGLIMMTTLTVDSAYVEGMKKEQYILPLMKLYIKTVKFDKLRPALIKAVQKHFRNETDDEKAYALSFFECIGQDESYRYSYLRAVMATGDIYKLEKFKKTDFAYLDGKVLVLIPENDMFERSDSQKLVDIFTNPVVKETYGGHLGMLMRADLYIKEIEKFLSENF